jgi:hypothetical protein
MKWLSVALLLACGCADDAKRPSLGAGYACGPTTCGENEYCATMSSGSQCQVNEDAGIGQYQTYSWQCVAVPTACDGVPGCVCDGDSFCYVSEDGRTVDRGCI